MSPYPSTDEHRQFSSLKCCKYMVKEQSRLYDVHADVRWYEPVAGGEAEALPQGFQHGQPRSTGQRQAPAW